MKFKSITLLALSLLFMQQLSAQTILWTEDFGDGPLGWETNTTLCGNFTGDMFGVWNLESITYNGTPVMGYTGSLEIYDASSYIAKLDNGTDESYLQAQYNITSDTFSSNIDTATIVMSTVTYGENGDGTDWMFIINETDNTLAEWGRTAFGLDTPTIAQDGASLTVTSTDGSTVLTYARSSSCANYFVWHHSGDVSNGLAAGADYITNSPTADNGTMVMNGDWFITEGVNSPGNPPYPQFITELISPVIDLSGVENAVSLQYHSFVRYLNLPSGAPQDASGEALRTSISISTDGGATWGTAINANPNMAFNDIYRNLRTIPLPDIDGESNVKIKFTYAADFYFWVIDDVSIIERVGYDMQAQANFYSVMPNAIEPFYMNESVPFIADILNVGGATATNVEYTLSISKDDTGEEVFSTTNEYASIAPDSLAENVIFPDMFSRSGMPTDTGAYTGTYILKHDSIDVETANDTLAFNFMVSENVFAKDLGATRNVTPSADNSFTFGNAFYVPESFSGNLSFTDMSFGVANADELAGLAVSTFLYAWPGDTNGDGQANSVEYTPGLLGFNSYTFTGDEGENPIMLPVEIDGAAIPITAGMHYLALVQYIDNTDQNCYLLAAQNIDYSAMAFVTDSLGAPRYAPVLEVGSEATPDLSLVAFGRDIVPTIRLYTNFGVATDEVILETNIAKLFPNPASAFANIEFNMDNATEVSLSIHNVDGQLVKTIDLGLQSKGIYQLDTKELSAGNYTVTLRTSEGIQAIPMVKVD